jgi:hypothetical protein
VTQGAGGTGGVTSTQFTEGTEVYLVFRLVRKPFDSPPYAHCIHTRKATRRSILDLAILGPALFVEGGALAEYLILKEIG